MKRFAVLLAVTVSLIFVGVASAATIQDLQALGYTVTLSNPGPAGQNCPVYFVTGHGVSEYINCNSQDVIDSLANPARICNADWQIDHPDQLGAFSSLTAKGWIISGDQCADVYTVTNPNTGVAAYSGSGAGLTGFDSQNGTPPAAVGNTPSVPVGGSSCLPLCPSPSDTPGGGTTTTPTAPTSPTTTTSGTDPGGTTGGADTPTAMLPSPGQLVYV